MEKRKIKILAISSNALQNICADSGLLKEKRCQIFILNTIIQIFLDIRYRLHA